jgi:hypothetical protein
MSAVPWHRTCSPRESAQKLGGPAKHKMSPTEEASLAPSTVTPFTGSELGNLKLAHRENLFDRSWRKGSACTESRQNHAVTSACGSAADEKGPSTGTRNDAIDPQRKKCPPAATGAASRRLAKSASPYRQFPKLPLRHLLPLRCRRRAAFSAGSAIPVSARLAAWELRENEHVCSFIGSHRLGSDAL